jgi:hypothetical protein
MPSTHRRPLEELAVDPDVGVEEGVVEISRFTSLELEQGKALLAQRVPIGVGHLDLDREPALRVVQVARGDHVVSRRWLVVAAAR